MCVRASISRSCSSGGISIRSDSLPGAIFERPFEREIDEAADLLAVPDRNLPGDRGRHAHRLEGREQVAHPPVRLVDAVDEDEVRNAELVERAERRRGERGSRGSGSTTTIATSAIASARAPSAAKPIEPGHIEDGELVAEIFEIVEVEFGRAAALAAFGAANRRCWSRWPSTPIGRWRRLRTASLRQGWSFPRRRVPPARLLGCLWMVRPAMRLSLRPVHGRASRSKRRSGACLETTTVRLFSAVGKRGSLRLSAVSSRNVPARAEVVGAMVDPKGHQASVAHGKCRAPAWKDIAARTYKRTWDDNVGLVAAGVAFYGFFALLSLLGLIVLVYGFVADPLHGDRAYAGADRGPAQRRRLRSSATS